MRSFHTIPISVSDSVDTYFLFDALLPETMSESTINHLIQLINAIRFRLGGKREVDRIFTEFLDGQPFVCFNFMLLPESTDKLRISSMDLQQLYIGQTSFPLSTIENDTISICMALLKPYLK